MQPERFPADDADDADDTNAEDAAWRSIVDNYGARPTLDDPWAETDPTVATDPTVESGLTPDPGAPFGGRFGNLVGGPVPTPEPVDEAEESVDEDEDAFVPPEPPPVPRASPDRMLAWIGIFGSPVVLLLSLILSISLPTFVAYLLICGFVGGFAYLVARMPRGPRDPWDDGAQI